MQPTLANSSVFALGKRDSIDANAQRQGLPPDRDAPRESNHDWVIVLAGGEGRRLRSITTSPLGVSVPKQFCSLSGEMSLLDETLRRARSLAPSSRVCAVVAAHHRQWWEEASTVIPDSNLFVQPASRGTGVGILLPLLHIVYRDPRARIIVLPCDHYVQEEGVLAQAMRQALESLRAPSVEVLMLGIEPELPDPELGYIVPGRIDGSDIGSVAQFFEKPSVILAQELIDRGALWNAFILAVTAQGLLRLFESRYMRAVRMMRIIVEASRRGLVDQRASRAIYEELPQIDFSRDVIAGQEASLRVFRVPRCGWSDLGTPRRVAEALRRLGSSEASRAAKAASASDRIPLVFQQ